MKKNEKRIMDGRSILGEICKSIKSIVYCVISVCLKIYFETLANVSNERNYITNFYKIQEHKKHRRHVVMIWLNVIFMKKQRKVFVITMVFREKVQNESRWTGCRRVQEGAGGCRRVQGFRKVP